MSEAIAAGAIDRFTALLPNLPDNSAGDEALREALREQQWPMVDALLHQLGPSNLATAIALAAQTGSLAELRAKTCAGSTIDTMISAALAVAAEENLTNAITPLLEWGAKPEARHSYALLRAIHKHHVPMALRLVPLSRPEAENYRPLREVTFHGLPTVLTALLDHAPDRPAAIAAALPGAGAAGLDSMLDTLLAEVPVQRNYDMQEALGQALIEASRHGHVRLVRRLLPLCPAARHAQHGEALRRALAHGFTEVVEILVATVDVEVLRASWLKVRPPRWEAVEQLAEHVTADVQKKWLASQKERFSKIRAQAREAKAHDLEPRQPGRPRARQRP